VTGVDVLTLGREMIIDPEWIEKIQRGREDTIVTTLKGADREALDLPSGFWNTIWSKPGWFPGV
jgi:2,4-dienoyl-CoA reductase-like NADH-dependent reductase (Old Yellow Enzyme family)